MQQRASCFTRGVSWLNLWPGLDAKVGASFHSMALAGGSIGGNFSPGLSWRLDRRLGLDGDSGPRALLDGVSWLNLWPGLDEKVGASLHSMA